MAPPDFISDADMAALESGGSVMPDFISDDQMSALDSQQESLVGWGPKTLSAVGRATNSALFGLPNALVSGAKTVADEVQQLRGLRPERSIGDTYSDYAGDFDALSRTSIGDTASTVADIGGGFINPVNKLGFVQKLNELPSVWSVFSKPVQAAMGVFGRGGVAAGSAALQNVIEGDGNALGSAKDAAVASTVLETVLGPAAKAASYIGRGILNKGIGLTSRDYIAAANELDAGTRGAGKARLLSALDQVENSNGGDALFGPLGYLNLGRTTESFLTQAANAAEAAAKPSAQRVANIIDETQALAGRGAQFDPDLGLIDNIVENTDAFGGEKVVNNMVDRWSALERKAAGRGGRTLQNLQKEKVSLNDRLNKNEVETEGANIWRRALRSALEKETDAAALAGGTSFDPGDLAAANREYGALSVLRDSFEKDLPAAQAADLAAATRQGMHTTSGLGSQGILNAATAGGPGAGILAAIGSALDYFKPLGRFGGRAIRDAADSFPELRLGLSTQPSKLRSEIIEAFDPVQGDTNRQEHEDGNKGEKSQDSKSKKNDNLNNDTNHLFNPTSTDDLNQQALFNLANLQGDYFEGGPSDALFDPSSTPFFSEGDVKPAADLVARVIKQESAGNPKAKSKKGAMGLMQIMPRTFKEVAGDLGLEDADPYDPEINRMVGEKYLGDLLTKYKGDEALALIAYNWGLGNLDKLIARKKTTDVAKLFGSLPAETQNYLKKILGQDSIEV